MPIRIVLDQGVARDAAVRLRDLEYECIHVGEVGLSTPADEEILAFALARSKRPLFQQFSPRPSPVYE
jgi:predicted nuclease of predicted toxin-antitoxin system